MIYPTINDLSRGDYNRYEIALATAKCARMITNEYVRQREEAERAMTGNKETDKPLNAMIDREVRDEKAVKIAIGRIHSGSFRIIHKDPEEQAREERAFLAGETLEEAPVDILDESSETADDADEIVDVEEDSSSDEELA